MSLQWICGKAIANNLEIAYEEMGPRQGPPVVLIMGLGSQLTVWPEALCRMLADAGHRVVRFDNRDIGLSQKMDGRIPPTPIEVVASSLMGLRPKVPYTLRDMAEDTVSLLDQLQIDRAHVVGASMGGMIAQVMALDHPERIQSLTIMMSSANWWGSHPKVSLHLMRRVPDGVEARIRHSMKTWQMIASPAYPTPDDKLREMIEGNYRRSSYREGQARQMAAVIAGGNRKSLLPKIQVPTLVVHGDRDIMVPVSRGVDLARLIPDAKLEVIEGMGHDFPEALLERFSGLIADQVARTAA